MRVSDRSVVAGVCAGLARRLGIDPTVLRVLTVVLALFAGLGVLLYALAWLLVPEQETGRSLGQRALRGEGPDSTRTVLLALGLALLAGVIAVGLLQDAWFPVGLLALLLLLAAALLSRRPAVPPSATAPASPAYPAAPASPAYPAPPASLAYPYAAIPEPTSGDDDAERPPRSALGALTVSLAAVSLGVLGLADAAGAAVPVSAYLALPLLVVGLGLVVGAWWGRSRGLVALGVLLALVLVPVATLERLDVAQRLDDAAVQRTLAPSDVAGLDGRAVELGAADLTYDLSAVDFSGTETDLAVRVGFGEMRVVVPADVTVRVDASVGAGELDLLGDRSEGVGLTRSLTDEGRSDTGTVVLDLEMGLGTVEVDRAAS
jgi:phage shock protein PspC (stress-responsive transcriptional regulator)